MAAAVRQPDSHPSLDAALNLLWPGLGQLNHDRPAGIYFALAALILVVAFAAYPDSRRLIGIAVAVLTVRSMADVLMVVPHRS